MVNSYGIYQKMVFADPQFFVIMSAMNDSDQDQSVYKVVINHEEQYSIWPADRENPLGWRDVGKQGLKEECLEYIKEVWTDMRPLSVRKQMDAARDA
jgi:MbtH protein